MIIITRTLAVLTLTGVALMSGLFFGYGNSVLPALEQLPAGQGTAAMNLMNVTIYNPLFLLIFSGTGLIGMTVLVIDFVRRAPGRWWVLAAGGLYLVAGMITMMINVPLNDHLASLDPAAADGRSAWPEFAAAWGPANTGRGLACTLAVVALGLALSARATPDPAPASR